MSFLAPMAVSTLALSADVKVTLTGDQEVPPIATAAMGSGTLTFGSDSSVAGGIATTGFAATSAHIHEGAPGTNGGAIIALVMRMDGRWVVPVGTRLTAPQQASFNAGNLYVDVHSDAHKDGEIRGQIRP
jgi:hypothetical protein